MITRTIFQNKLKSDSRNWINSVIRSNHESKNVGSRGPTSRPNVHTSTLPFARKQSSLFLYLANSCLAQKVTQNIWPCMFSVYRIPVKIPFSQRAKNNACVLVQTLDETVIDVLLQGLSPFDFDLKEDRFHKYPFLMFTRISKLKGFKNDPFFTAFSKLVFFSSKNIIDHLMSAQAPKRNENRCVFD